MERAKKVISFFIIQLIFTSLFLNAGKSPIGKKGGLRSIFKLKSSSERIEVKSWLEKSKIVLGEDVKFFFRVTYPENIEIKIPNIYDFLSEFQVKDVKASSPEPPRRTRRKSHRLFRVKLVKYEEEYLISPLVADKFIIDEIEVAYKDEKGEWRVAKTKKLFLNVVPDKKIKEKDIHDIKPNAYPEINKNLLIIIISALFIVSGIGVFLYFFIKNRQKLKVIPPLTPYEIAKKRLDELKNINISNAESLKEFYFHISSIFREYIEGTYSIKALEMTTNELKPYINEKFDSKTCGAILDLLNFSDVVKFAKFIPTEEDNNKYLKTLELLIEEIKISK